ncbi:MAG TPA: hypothetical protein VJ646_04620 [Candidatus Binatia bacterium]|nr:hypothetical protein [Candidatus Binatia bacterium]
MRRIFLTIATLVISLALNGCAVLTIDVDVYKGALANHESVQTEQTAAMAMGAKPLLAKLRYRLERAECDNQKKGTSEPKLSGKRLDGAKCPKSADLAESKAGVIPQDDLQSPDALQVNDILSLYEDAAGQILSPFADAARRLSARIEEGYRIVKPYLYDAKHKRLPDADECADLLAKRVRNLPYTGRGCLREPTKSQIAAVKAVWEAIEHTWQEAIRVLSSNEIRKRLSELPGDLIWDVAWVAGDLTSGEGLRNFFTDNSIAPEFKSGSVAMLRGQMSRLNDPDNPLTPDAENAVGAVVTQMLAEDPPGPWLAKQLAVAQSYAATRQGGKWFIVVYPTADWFEEANVKGSLADVRLAATLQRAAGNSLGAGRPDKGIEKLIDDYLRVSRLPLGSQGSKETSDRKRELFDGLINFAEKVSIIANFDPLLRDRHEDTRKYVRVLQAVGNSILSQVDALRQGEAHRGQLTRARETEVEGIRNAEARSAAVLNVIAAELKSKPDDFPRKQLIEKALKGGKDAIGEVISQIELALAPGRSPLEAARLEAAKWDTTAKVLAQKEVHDAIEQYENTTVQQSTAEIASKIIPLIEKLETDARRLGGTGDDAARDFQTTASVLSDTKFMSDTGNPGRVEDKFRGIELEVNRQLAAARKLFNQDDEKKWSAVATILRRKDILDVVKSFGTTTEPRTVSDVAKEAIRTLRPREADARRLGGAGDEVARAYQTAADVLSEPKFTIDTANPGRALDKLKDIELQVGRQRDAARKIESVLAAPVADLERWHRQAASLTKGGLPGIKIPEWMAKGDKVSEDGQKPNAKDVLDTMLATLRYDHVNAVADGRNSEQAKDRAAAVELLYAYRSGMVHIRPASTFLRNSYPASVLQQDPTGGVWRNMLTDHAWHQLPFYGLIQEKLHKEDIDINRTIDKQFWQSVNQVRVSGAGRTNYAIAKDDVGNWYVKSYSSNPTDIIQSAKNLAMFSAGNAMGANFLARGGQRSATSAPTGEAPTQVPTTKVARSTLGGQFDRVTKRYEEQTLKSRANLVEDIKSINPKLKTTLPGHGVEPADLDAIYTQIVSPPDSKLVATLTEKNETNGRPKSTATLNGEIASGLRYLKNYRAQVQSKLTTHIAKDDNPDPSRQIGKTAGLEIKTEIDRTFKDLLDRYIKERQGATGQYESTLLFISESAGI